MCRFAKCQSSIVTGYQGQFGQCEAMAKKIVCFQGQARKTRPTLQRAQPLISALMETSHGILWQLKPRQWGPHQMP
jgi:hypothetical protein